MRDYLYSLATDQRNGFFAGIIKLFLLMLAFIYQLIAGLRNVLFNIGIFRQQKVDRPVISVGNITMGGSGKTPLVVYLVRALKRRKLLPAVLIRGFMQGKTGAESDEGQMLSEQFVDVAVVVGADRFKNAELTLKKRKVDVFVMDDGFQHRHLSRNLDIVVIDALNPWGNKRTIPRGILREPIQSLKRADIAVISRADAAKESLESIRKVIKEVNPDVLICEGVHHPYTLMNIRSAEQLETIVLTGKKVCSLCSIGNPESFTKTLLDLGCEVIKEFSFIDHYVYTQKDIARVVNFCRSNHISYVITTQKDFPKIRRFINDFGIGLHVLVLEIHFSFLTGEDQFLERVDNIL